MWHHLRLDEFVHIVWLGVLTMSRVAAMSIIATLIWTPFGVVIGFHPKSGKHRGMPVEFLTVEQRRSYGCFMNG